MNLKKLILTKNRCYTAGKTIKPKGIMVHSTGANNPNLKRYVGPDDGLLGKNTIGNHWNSSNKSLSACVHAFIGKLKDGSIATYQTLPWNHRGWHAASGKNGSANDTHISFEICEDGLKDKTYFDKVYKEAVELCAYLCRMYDLSTSTIICHSEGYKKGIASNHGDVMHWFPKHGKSMDTFRADVKKLLNEDSKEEAKKPASNTTSTASTKKVYRIRKTWADKDSQLGAFTKLSNAKKGCPDGYSVYDWNGKTVYVNYSLKSFIKDVQKVFGVTDTGVATTSMLSKTVTISAKKNSKHPAVFLIQKRLFSLGYTQVGEPDGSAGPKFTAAVKAFQKGGTQDGEITKAQRTWRKLLGI